jgi:hypothetical protein
MCMYAGVVLSNFDNGRANGMDVNYYLVPIGLALVVSALGPVALAVYEPPAWRNAVLAALAPFVVYAWSASYALAVTRANSAREPWVQDPTLGNVRILRNALQLISREKTGTSNDIEVAVQAPAGDRLAWYLRDFPHATFVDAVAPNTAAPAVITPLTTVSPTLGVAYTGAGFTLSEAWSPGTDPLHYYWLEWLVTRGGGTRVPADEVVLWKVAPTAPQGTQGGNEPSPTREEQKP